MTHEDEENFQKAEKCHNCDIDIRVRDHCHITVKITVDPVIKIVI